MTKKIQINATEIYLSKSLSIDEKELKKLDKKKKDIEQKIKEKEKLIQAKKLIQEKNTEAPMDAQDQTQLAYLAESLMRAPSQYRRLIEIVREENASPSANLREALDELVSALDQHLDAGKDPYDGLCSAAEDLFKKSGPARYAGRALAGSLENYRMLQQKSAQNR